MQLDIRQMNWVLDFIAGKLMFKTSLKASSGFFPALPSEIELLLFPEIRMNTSGGFLQLCHQLL